MKIAGIIAEFNPFHRGHEIPIAAARALVKDGAVVCIMSGNCVQRGDLAVFRKSARAEAAVRAGADLVLELPAPYVLASAERFARGGIALLAAMGIPDISLVFAAETPSADTLATVANCLDEPLTQAAIRQEMMRGIPYGAACQAAVEQQLGAEDSAAMREPNNLLGIEYIRAILHFGAAISPVPIRRQAVGHHSRAEHAGYAAATHIRSLLLQDGDGWSYMPHKAVELFRRECKAGRGPVTLTQIETAVLALLRRKPPVDVLDDSEGLSQRIWKMAGQAGSLDELISLAKTKRYHEARIRRMILSMCLGLHTDDRPEIPPYMKILAANQTGRHLIRQITKTANIPVITRHAQTKKLSDVAVRLGVIESSVTDLQALCFQRLEVRAGGSEWRVGAKII